MNKILLNKQMAIISFTVAATFAFVPNASATPEILNAAKAKGVKATVCTSCHTSSAASSGNLKPVLGSLPAKTYRDAYKADPSGFTKLKNVINGCGGQSLNPNTFLCQVQAPFTGAVGSTTSGAAATDMLTVTCGSGTANLYARVKDNTKGTVPVSTQAKKGGASSALSVDKVGGDALYSPAVAVKGTAGAFTVNVNKPSSSTKGVEAYAADIYCRNAAGAKTSTSIKVTQNH